MTNKFYEIAILILAVSLMMTAIGYINLKSELKNTSGAVCGVDIEKAIESGGLRYGN